MLTPLRKHRQDRKKTLEDVAPDLGLTPGQLSRIEREGTHSLPTALKIAEATGIPVEALAPKGDPA